MSMVFSTEDSISPSARSRVLPGLACLGIAGFSALALAVSVGWTGVDDGVASWVDQYYDKPRTDALEALVYATMALGGLIALVLTALLLIRRNWLGALFWTLAILGVVILDVILKEAFRRPSLVKGSAEYSFPSGNAMASVAFVAALALLTSSGHVRRRLLLAGIPAVIAYGALLVFIWWHYVSDVVAGWFIALAWVTGLALAMQLLRRTGIESGETSRLKARTKAPIT